MSCTAASFPRNSKRRLSAKQTYLKKIDLTRTADELIAEVREHVATYGASGYIDAELLRN